MTKEIYEKIIEDEVVGVRSGLILPAKEIPYPRNLPH
jgi:hypothetical protein